MAPGDPILSLSLAFREDSDENKVNLGIGAYRDDDGKPYVFKAVHIAEKKIVDDPSLDKEYLPIDGLAEFTKGARGAVFGWDHPDVKSGRVASLQTLSGTGALRLAADFLAKFRPAPVYVSDPTWGNHNAIFKNSGLEVKQCRQLPQPTPCCHH